MKKILFWAVLLLSVVPAAAQVNVDANKVYLGSNPRAIQAGTGNPGGAVTGSVCDILRPHRQLGRRADNLLEGERHELDGRVGRRDRRLRKRRLALVDVLSSIRSAIPTRW